ncbi:MAG: hypothetical protein JSR95_10165 [Proteobacteria bacterium]|nr:hypothetical protein [Pseudomonadota bacterium]
METAQAVQNPVLVGHSTVACIFRAVDAAILAHAANRCDESLAAIAVASHVCKAAW